MREAELEQALAVLLASTRRSRRQPNLLETARALEKARGILGSLQAVADRVDLSTEMLREFASVSKLSPGVKAMVRRGVLTSVDAAYRLSMLPAAEQKWVADEYCAGNLSGKDLRDLLSLWNRNTRYSVRESLKLVKKTRDIKRFLIKVPCSGAPSDAKRLQRAFASLVGDSNLISLRVSADEALIVLSENGHAVLQEEARRLKKTKKQLVRQLLGGR